MAERIARIAGLTVVSVPMPRDGECAIAQRRSNPRERVLVLPDDMPVAEALPLIAEFLPDEQP